MVVPLMGAEVMPGRGLGPIMFGTQPELVERSLGEADESSFTRDGEYSCVQLTYSYGVTFYFSVTEGMRLDSFEVDSRSAVQLFGEPLFPRTREEVLALLRRGLSASEQQAIQVTRNEDLEEIMMKVGALGAEFYFDLSENLQTVHCGVFFDEEDDIVWPS